MIRIIIRNIIITTVIIIINCFRRAVEKKHLNYVYSHRDKINTTVGDQF